MDYERDYRGQLQGLIPADASPEGSEKSQYPALRWIWNGRQESPARGTKDDSPARKRWVGIVQEPESPGDGTGFCLVR